MSYIYYIFWPRPPVIAYSNAKMQIILFLCVFLIFFSMYVKRWRRKQKNTITRKLSRSWGAAMFWFGIVGLVLAVSRAEDVSYLSMRFLWIVWLGILLLYVYVQVRTFRAKHYVRLDAKAEEDPREKYLPKKKRHK